MSFYYNGLQLFWLEVGKKGIVILSGLLFKDETEIINHYQSIGFIFKEKKVMDEWLALVLMAHG